MYFLAVAAIKNQLKLACSKHYVIIKKLREYVMIYQQHFEKNSISLAASVIDIFQSEKTQMLSNFVLEDMYLKYITHKHITEIICTIGLK